MVYGMRVKNVENIVNKIDTILETIEKKNDSKSILFTIYVNNRCIIKKIYPFIY